MTALELAGAQPLGTRDRLVAAARVAGYLPLAVLLGGLGVLALPTLLFGSTFPGRLAERERRLANAALHARIPELSAEASSEARRLAARLPLRLAAAVAAAVIALVPIALTVGLAVRAAEGLVGPSELFLGPWALGPAVGTVLAVLAVAAAVVSVAVLDGLTRPLRAVERRLLGAGARDDAVRTLRARVEELRASRARIVESGTEARRRLERDLHEGAQQHLVALSLELSMLRARVAGDPEALKILDAAVEKLNAALAELRELARGIHPAILTHRGLDGAIVALLDRTQLTVDYENNLDERVSPAAETAGYFVVREALTNVLEYAGVPRASVRVRRERDALVVEVEDDGAGGADPGRGSGLRGLEDRVAALDGTLTVESPAGAGTRVTARIPVEPV
jgi:signal transduction histidine kinase